ncbi:unnamed protein product [Adineta steineri]|uniref:Uncharacterized protein n=1 Tax=Adineta steineri TaxID=433720 RepID=A0A813NCI9_9BILA|nr:unnamed protein product [Adineta steineri]CAF3823550.1 unnamed protein product [Adineta steineri]
MKLSKEITDAYGYFIEEEQPTAANAASEEITVQETINQASTTVEEIMSQAAPVVQQTTNQAPNILSMIDINEVDQDKYNYEELKKILKAAISENRN